MAKNGLVVNGRLGDGQLGDKALDGSAIKRSMDWQCCNGGLGDVAIGSLRRCRNGRNGRRLTMDSSAIKHWMAS